MTRNVDSLIAVAKAVIDAEPWYQDPKCSPIPWRSELFDDAQSRPLIIAVMKDDGVVKTHPSVARVLDNVVEKLREAGHEIMAWTPGSLHKECIEIMVGSARSRTQWFALTPAPGPILHSRWL